MKLLSMKQVQQLLPLSRAQIDRYVHDPEYVHLDFPKPTRIGHRVFWVHDEVADWIAKQVDKRAS